MSYIKIRQSIVEKYLNDYAHLIQHMDDYTFPEVMLELQAEEAEIQHIKDHKSITAFSREALEQVFTCWFDSGEADAWFDAMALEEEALQFQENENGPLKEIKAPGQ